jgi:C4-dicarboxylate-specific signal transduction histidine kinase
MPNAVDETNSVTATVFRPDPPRAIIAEEPNCAWSAPAQPASGSEPRGREARTELASANRVAILEQLWESISEINQPICSVVMYAEAALRLLLAQPTDTEAVRRLLAVIVKEGMRTGEIVHRTCAVIKKAPL